RLLVPPARMLVSTVTSTLPASAHPSLLAQVPAASAALSAHSPGTPKAPKVPSYSLVLVGGRVLVTELNHSAPTPRAKALGMAMGAVCKLVRVGIWGPVKTPRSRSMSDPGREVPATPSRSLMAGTEVCTAVPV